MRGVGLGTALRPEVKRGDGATVRVSGVSPHA